MSTNVIISIIIPVFNASAHLKRCLDSVLNNTYKNLEIICVDDGSADNSFAILSEYAKKDNRVIAVHQENSGTAAARNKGLEIATGKYIAFLDNDDWIHKEFYMYLLNMITHYNADMAVCGYLRTQQKEIEDCKLNTSSLKCTVYKGDSAIFGPGITDTPIWHSLYDAELIKNLRFPTDIKIEDIPFALSVVCAKPDIICCVSKEKLYYHFDHWGSRVNTFSLNDQYQLLLFYKREAENALKNNDDRCASIYYAHAIKRGLSFRYQCRNLPRQELVFHTFLKESIREFKKLSYPTIEKKKFWELLVKYPEIYYTGHLLKNPALLKYELREKKRRKNK